MEMHAYDELYVSGAQRVLGHAFDFAVSTCRMDLDFFVTLFCISKLAEQFERGNPKYIAGKTGCELARDICEKSGIGDITEEDVMYVDRSPEFWLGWSLAYFQWKTGCRFHTVQTVISMNELLNWYEVYHEADISKFCLDLKCRLELQSETNLARIRHLNQYSQSILAYKAGVNIRQIQLFEQRQRDINKASANTLIRLSRALSCRPEELMESWDL